MRGEARPGIRCMPRRRESRRHGRVPVRQEYAGRRGGVPHTEWHHPLTADGSERYEVAAKPVKVPIVLFNFPAARHAAGSPTVITVDRYPGCRTSVEMAPMGEEPRRRSGAPCSQTRPSPLLAVSGRNISYITRDIAPADDRPRSASSWPVDPRQSRRCRIPAVLPRARRGQPRLDRGRH